MPGVRLFIFSILMLFAIHATAQEGSGNERDGDTILSRRYNAPLPKFKLVTFDTLAKNYEGRKLKQVRKALTKKLGYTPVTNVITEADLREHGNFILVIFNPMCGNCEDQLDLIKENIDSFNNTHIYMVGDAAMKRYIPDFLTLQRMSKFRNQITVGVDSAGYIDQVFHFNDLPQVSIYNSDLKLQKIYNGGVRLKGLTPYFNRKEERSRK